MLVEILFWGSLIGLAHIYFGYPFAVWLGARLRPRPVTTDDWQPRVDIVVVAWNAAADIGAKLDNLHALDYPAARLRIHVAFDGCDDDSVEVVQRRNDSSLHMHVFPQRRGKSACLGDVIAQLDGEVVVFTDVRQRLEADSVLALLRPLADPAVGAVSGELMFERAGSGFAGGVDFYWRYEKFVRRNESLSGSVIGVTGALYAARRELLPTVPGGLILDDLWIPLAIAGGGARILFAEDALAWDRPSTDPAREARRKRRTLAGNYQLIARDPSLLLPWRHPLGWRLWGHKWLRLLAPWMLATAIVTNAMLLDRGGIYPWLFSAQLGAWALALVGALAPVSLRLFPVRIASTFARMNWYAVLGLIDFIRDREAHLWASNRAADEVAS
ncbi:MAG: glycosyltransferase family 2 protein [Dokdonella sp.]